MKLQNKKKRIQYSHKDIQGIMRSRERKGQPYSHMHPQISPSGVDFMEDDDALAIVSDAKRRYISNGWMPNRRVSEAAETKRDITALMSLEGTLSAAVHNAIQGYEMFDAGKGLEYGRGARVAPPVLPVPQPEAGPDVESEEKEQLAEQVRESKKVDIGVASQGLGQAVSGLSQDEAAAHVIHHATGVQREAAQQSLGPDTGNIVGDYAQVTDPSQIRPRQKKSPKHSIKPPSAPNATSAQESIEEAQGTTIPETTPAVPTVDQDNEPKDSQPAKKTRNTKKKQYRAECDKCGIKWRKSWNTKKLKSKIDAYNIENVEL